MNNKSNIVVILTLLFLFPTVVQSISFAETYYVDAINGNDADPGTSEQPWKTLNRAYTWYSGSGARVQEGDTVYFKNGNYGQFRESTEDGQSRYVHRTNWVTYKNAPGHTPHLTQITVLNNDRGWGDGQDGDSYLVFDGFDVNNTIDFLPPVYVRRTEYVKILNCTVKAKTAWDSGLYAPYYHGSVYGIDIRDTNCTTIQGCDVSHVVRPISISETSNHCLIKDNYLHNFAEDGMSGGGDYLTFEGNHVFDVNVYRTDIRLDGTLSGPFIIGETVNQAVTGAVGIVSGQDPGRTWITVYQTTSVQFKTAVDGGGTVTGETSGQTIVEVGPYVDTAHSDGFQYAPGSAVHDIVVRGNYFDTPNAGIKFGSIFGDPMSNITIENNIVYDSSFNGWGSLTLSSVNNVTICNNTFYNERIRIGYGIRWGICRITNFYNNIINYLYLDPNNSIFTNHGNNIFKVTPDDAGSSGVYEFVVNGTEQIIGGSSFDNLFVDVTANNYKLQDGSAAINFGNPAYAPTTDIDGNPRDALPDAGCYEYGAKPLKGDLNKDGEVNIQDVQCCVNHIQGKQDWGERADVNGDGKVDESDVQEIIKIILER